MVKEKKISVYADWQSIDGPVLIGTLSASYVRGKEVFQFAYDKDWLKSPHAMLLDPDIQFFTGPQYLPEGKVNFGMFLDSSPDRWGRLLMRRREAIYARKEHRPPAKLFEADYLLGVHDLQRSGALRFKDTQAGAFMSHEAYLPAPPWSELRKLEEACSRFEEDTSADFNESEKWLRLILAPGSSLGGARPKSGVKGKSGMLWIAKFPSRRDEIDVGAWEMAVHRMAKDTGIKVADARMEQYGSLHHTFLTKRFDRKSNGKRLHYSSAMTMLGYMDGADASEGASYLEIAEFIIQQGAQPDVDLPELWKRIVFNICISNTDDHLRNHGFLLTSKGWTLSPAFDMNPVPGSFGLSLNIDEADNSLDLDLVCSVADYFRVTPMEQEKVLKNIRKIVKAWETYASKCDIPKSERETMKSAFTASTAC